MSVVLSVVLVVHGDSGWQNVHWQHILFSYNICDAVICSSLFKATKSWQSFSLGLPSGTQALSWGLRKIKFRFILSLKSTVTQQHMTWRGSFQFRCFLFYFVEFVLTCLVVAFPFFLCTPGLICVNLSLCQFVCLVPGLCFMLFLPSCFRNYSSSSSCFLLHLVLCFFIRYLACILDFRLKTISSSLNLTFCNNLTCRGVLCPHHFANCNTWTGCEPTVSDVLHFGCPPSTTTSSVLFTCST